MASFNNLKDLETYLKLNMHQVLRDSMELENELANIMSQTIIEKVYEEYTPETKGALESRRGENNLGLSDPRNMIISDVLIEKGQVRIIFENIAEGRDTMRDDMLVDAFENPTKTGHWKNLEGEWADRPFINATIEKVKQNPSNMLTAIKKNLRDAGFVIAE